MGAPTGLSTVGARSKSLSDDVYGRSSARTLAKGVATKGNRRRLACHDTGHLPILSVSRHENRLFGRETLRDTYESVHLSVSRLGNRLFGPETLRDTYEASHLSVSWRENHIFGPETFRDTYGAAHLSVS